MDVESDHFDSSFVHFCLLIYSCMISTCTHDPTLLRLHIQQMLMMLVLVRLGDVAGKVSSEVHG